ncbi:MAG: aquaporin Z [Thermoplasmata archaeon]|nr:aquaporin Z [Thermoplasmata archaeon]
MSGIGKQDSIRKYSAEFLGTLALVFFGCGGAVIAGAYIGFLGIALAFGMVLLVLVYAIGPISGCHVNPAVTVSMYLTKKISSKDALAYIGVQCAGAIAGAALLYMIASGMPGWEIADGLGQNGFEDASPAGFTLMACFIAEVFLTFFFVYVILEVTSKNVNKGFEGLAIGFALFLVHIVGIPITGTSVNPARSLGPALFAGGTAIEQLWLFWAAPLLGAIIAAFVWMYLANTKLLKE